jgi:hypothetical protein
MKRTTGPFHLSRSPVRAASANGRHSSITMTDMLQTTNGRGGVDLIVPVGQQSLAIERYESL